MKSAILTFYSSANGLVNILMNHAYIIVISLYVGKATFVTGFHSEKAFHIIQNQKQMKGIQELVADGRLLT